MAPIIVPDRPRLPEVGEFVRGTGKLVAVEEIQPPPQPLPTKDYIFEQISARVEVRLHGKALNKGESFSDFYGRETSVESAVEQAKRYAEKNRVTHESDVEVVAVKVVSYYRARPIQRDNLYAREFQSFEYLSVGCAANVPPETETVVWSSKHPEEPPSPSLTEGGSLDGATRERGNE